MKKRILSIFLMIIAIVPMVFFAGCSNESVSANDITNRTYFVTRLARDTEEDTLVKSRNMRITFYSEHFKLEFSYPEQKTIYWFYMGTYETEENLIKLKPTTYGGVYNEESLDVDYKLSVLKFNKHVLSYEFVNPKTNKVISYRFELI